MFIQEIIPLLWVDILHKMSYGKYDRSLSNFRLFLIDLPQKLSYR